MQFEELGSNFLIYFCLVLILVITENATSHRYVEPNGKIAFDASYRFYLPLITRVTRPLDVKAKLTGLYK